MSQSTITIPEEYLNLLKNDIIKFECAPLVYRIVIEWGFAKPDGVKIIDHFKDMEIEERSGINLRLRKWLKINATALDATDYSSFGVTTLHDFLPILCCDKVTQTGGSEYVERLKDPNSIEYLLKEIKSYRNEVSQDYSKARENPNIEAMRDLMRRSIRTAGVLYGKDQSEIDARVADLDAKFDELVRMTTAH